MKILLPTTEAVPFVKTGGLGDVCGALPVELARLGHEPVVIMPAFRQVFQAGLPIEETGISLEIPVGTKSVPGTLLRSQLPASSVPVYFVRQDDYFDRPELYRVHGEDYRDNCERFVFFSRAVLEAIRLLNLGTQLLHSNDWPTGLVPAYLEIEYRGVPQYEHIVSLFTVHNLAYQGNFWHWDMLLTGLDWKYFNFRQMEFYGNLSLLKTGLAFADALTTVSPRYAQEIQSAPLGSGMEGILRHRRDELTGIINGVDYRDWNPATDKHLAVHYDEHSVHEGKRVCREAVRRELGLPDLVGVPLIAMIGRLADQKGLDVLVPVIEDWAESSPVQWVILGTGEPKYHEMLGRLAKRFPQKVAVRLEFSDRLAHQIEAGADLLVMPSQFEPCGLNQLYSLKYGTVPVVRATGGLADTIVDTTDQTLADGTATGFCFYEHSRLALSESLRRATTAYGQADVWQKLIQTAMRQDWSWARSAREYSELYARTVTLRKSALLAT